MGNIWFVEPETVRVDLDFQGSPFWLTLKRELTIGERRKMETGGFRGLSKFGGEADESAELSIDWRQQNFARTMTYVKDWSLADDKGNKIPFTRESVEALRPDVYDVIDKAITAHVERMDAEKKAPAGAGEQSATSA